MSAGRRGPSWSPVVWHRKVARSSCGVVGDELPAQRLAVELEAMGVVNDAVEDGVGDGQIADDVVPAIYRDLAGDECGAARLPPGRRARTAAPPAPYRSTLRATARSGRPRPPGRRSRSPCCGPAACCARSPGRSSPSALSRNISLTLRIGTLSAGIGSPLAGRGAHAVQPEIERPPPTGWPTSNRNWWTTCSGIQGGFCEVARQGRCDRRRDRDLIEAGLSEPAGWRGRLWGLCQRQRRPSPAIGRVG